MFFDLEYKLRTDPAYFSKVKKAVEDIGETSLMLRKSEDPSARQKHSERLLEYLRLTHFNVAPLLGYYFPNFKSGPYSLKDFPFAYCYYTMCLGPGSYTVFRGSRQIGKTTNHGIATTLFPYLLPGLSISVIVPRPDQLYTIQNKFREIEYAFRFFSKNKDFRNNLSYKEYPHDGGKMSTVRLWYALTSAEKIRGSTNDWLLYDEYQDFNESLEYNIAATQSRNQRFSSTTYSGTSKSIYSALEKRWNGSSMSEWIMPCSACKFDNIPTVKEGVLDMIQPKGICCKKCGRPLNVREGHWEASSPEMLELNRFGFHIPQLIVPANTEDKAIWINIYQKYKSLELNKFMEEYLGEATERGSSEITIDDLMSICTLGDQKELIKNIGTKKDPYVLKVSGCDWGGSDYNPATKTKVSYTVHCVIGVLPTNKMHLLSATQYSGMDYDDVVHSIARCHRQFGCSALAGDFGEGKLYIHELKKIIGPFSVVALKYGLKNKYIDIPKESENYGNMYTLNRSESITNLYFDIKKHNILSPKWEQMGRLLSQLLNLVRVPQETPSGENILRYDRIPSEPDDMLHAMNFGITLAKMLRGIPLFDSPEKQAMFNNYMRTGSFSVPRSPIFSQGRYSPA